ncbi:FGGY-family carbohydrate kinase, partial [Leucobacter ruminantium]
GLVAGIPMCPPEGDAGTGMVATCSVAPRSANVSVGTSVFAMVVLERGISAAHHEIDLVTTPSGDPVAMVHCNNGASELAAWAGLFREFAAAVGSPVAADDAFAALYGAARRGATDGGGLLAYNHLSGEPIVGLVEGRPLVVRTPGSELSLANFMRVQLYGVFATLSLGMEVLASEGVAIDRVRAHGGVFRTAGVAQQVLADALGAPVAVADTASEGGAWGMAVLAAYLHRAETPLHEHLERRVFATTEVSVLDPEPDGAVGYAAYLGRYRAGLAAERAALAALPAG